jgi:hypothetical protein
MNALDDQVRAAGKYRLVNADWKYTGWKNTGGHYPPV